MRELQVDLLGGRRDFDDAYELLSKELSEELLARLHGEVRALTVSMTQDEAEKLYSRIKEFIHRESREPNLNSPNGREVRLAEALAFLRKISREKRAAMAGADEGRSMRETIDYLNDELLLTPDEKPKAARTPVLDRAVEVIERINAFMDETGAEPVSERAQCSRAHARQ
ncbi:hypothetical protein HGG75_17555 [Ochrobactrum pseudogrignonense]|nr:hypothetical protein [Brucella pseudogrignonensis]